MKNLGRIVAKLESELDEKDRVREGAMRASRTIVRLAGSAIHGLHRGVDVKKDLAALKKEVSRLSRLLSKHPDIAVAGYVETAYQEYAEACILLSLLEKDDVPAPEELGIGGAAYLLGLADSLGELRRFCLDALKSGDVKRADHFLGQMDEIFAALMRFDYPEAVVPIRRKQDVARSLLEKTRGEVAVAASASRLHERLDKTLKG